MFIIYSEKITPRLRYVCQFIFSEQMNLEWMLTLDEFYPAPRGSFFINYSNKSLSNAHLTITPHGLLHQTGISPQDAVVAKNQEGNFMLFPTQENPEKFDMFSAIFYLLSRYEEYLPHTKDMYGRFPHEQSLAYQNGFLKMPLVNVWVNDLANLINKQVGEINMQPRLFECRISYDIDMAWSYKHKGLWRNLLGFIKKPEMKRWRVLLGYEADPFDTFQLMNNLHDKYKVTSLYFFLMARRWSRYDKNISVFKQSMQKLIKAQAEKYTIGLHPSWRSHRISKQLVKEKKALEEIAGHKVIHSRQHYIKWQLPDTFQQLINQGIKHDYSMGYGSINGFRASVASSFLWYDLQQEKITSLRLHPFCFMDANCHYEQKLNIQESEAELQYYYNVSRQNNGTFIPVFHNHFLGSESEFNGWHALWERFLSSLSQ